MGKDVWREDSLKELLYARYRAVQKYRKRPQKKYRKKTENREEKAERERYVQRQKEWHFFDE